MVADRESGRQRESAGGLRLEVDGGVATVTLARPERRNAQSPAMWEALAGFGDDLPDEVRLVIVRGEGPSFSAGLDLHMLEPGGVEGETSLAELSGLDDTDIERFIAGAQQAFAWLRRPDLVSVAAVHGHAIGAGFQLALACDLRVAAEDAQLSMREPSLGLVPDLGGTKPLVDAVGLSRALEVCLTGRFIGAAEARELRLAELVVPAEELEATIQDLASALLATPRDAATATKALLVGGGQRSLDEQLAAERQAQVRRLRALFAGG